MSVLTTFLKLFKYDNTDKTNNANFNIQTALNDNWDKVEENAKAVNQEMEHKADKAKINEYLSTVGWKRFASVSTEGDHRGFAIFQIGSHYENNYPFSTTFIVNITYNDVSITPIGTTLGTPIIPKVRAVYLNGKVYLELYYNVALTNPVFIQMVDSYNFTLLDNFIDGSVPTGYNVKEVSLSNSLSTDKIDILLTAQAGYTIVAQNCCKINNVLYINFSVKKTNDTFFEDGNIPSVAISPISINNLHTLSYNGQSGGTATQKGTAIMIGNVIYVSATGSITTQVNASGVIVL